MPEGGSSARATTFETEGKQVPLPYTIAYDPRHLDERMSYAVSVRITVGRKLTWSGDTRTPALTRGAPGDLIEVSVVQVGGSMETKRVFDVLRAFEGLGVEYVLVGAVAVGFQGLVRATGDLDLFVRPTEHNVDLVRQALHSLWTDPSIDEIRTEDLAGEYPTIRYGPPGEDFVIDLLARLGDAFTFDSLESQTRVIEGVRVCLATPRQLYLMKKDTMRPRDRIDAEALRQKYGLEDS